MRAYGGVWPQPQAMAAELRDAGWRLTDARELLTDGP